MMQYYTLYVLISDQNNTIRRKLIHHVIHTIVLFIAILLLLFILARFLRACNWSVPNTVEMLTSFYKMLRKYPQYTLDLTASQLDHVWKAQMNGSILKRDQHGRRFYFYRYY